MKVTTRPWLAGRPAITGTAIARTPRTVPGTSNPALGPEPRYPPRSPATSHRPPSPRPEPQAQTARSNEMVRPVIIQKDIVYINLY